MNSKIRNSKAEVTAYAIDAQRIIRHHYKLYLPIKEQPRRNGKILRNTDSSKTEPGRVESMNRPNYQ